MRKGRLLLFSVNLDEDSFFVVLERRYKYRGGSLENKENKNGFVGVKYEFNRRDIIGYVDIDAFNVVYEFYSLY